MVLRVVDRDGALLHDCRQLGCTVSWDGYTIATGAPAQGRKHPGVAPGFKIVGDTARRS